MKYKLTLLVILVLAFFLRIYKIDSVPSGLSNDEIAIAYNSYSIVETGRDEYGEFMPISFKSHNDFKAPLYIYIAAPFIKFFGNNELAVRLPSIFFGSLTCLVLGLLIFNATGNKRLALLSAFVLAITPWHVMTSRWASESNLALFFVVVGILFFIKGLKKPLHLYFSALSFVLSIYSYHTERVFVPILLITLLIIFWKELLVHRKTILIVSIFSVMLIFPLYSSEIKSTILGETTRVATQSITNDHDLSILKTSKESSLGKSMVTVKYWSEKYYGYISPRYLFFTGLPISKQFSSYQTGLFNIFFLIPFIVGLVSVFKNSDKFSKLIIALFFIGPIVPSLTQGDYNLLRNLISIVPVVIIISFGLFRIMENKRLFVLLLVAIIGHFLYSYYFYMNHFPKQLAENWSYGFKEISVYVRDNTSDYNKIVIDPNYGSISNNLVGVPALFILYFGEYDPDRYLSEFNLDNGYLKFDKFEFRPVDWPKEEISSGELYIVGTHSNPIGGQKVKKIHSIYLPNGFEEFKMYSSYE